MFQCRPTTFHKPVFQISGWSLNCNFRCKYDFDVFTICSSGLVNDYNQQFKDIQSIG